MLHAGYYFTGDGALRDEDGHYRITGRVDDVINISGHRLGTAEIEDALVGGTWKLELGTISFIVKKLHIFALPQRFSTIRSPASSEFYTPHI